MGPTSTNRVRNLEIPVPGKNTLVARYQLCSSQNDSANSQHAIQPLAWEVVHSKGAAQAVEEQEMSPADQKSNC